MEGTGGSGERRARSGAVVGISYYLMTRAQRHLSHFLLSLVGSVGRISLHPFLMRECGYGCGGI